MLRLQTLHAGSARIQQTSKQTNDFYRDFLQKNEISPFYNFLMEHKLISHAILIPPQFVGFNSLNKHCFLLQDQEWQLKILL